MAAIEKLEQRWLREGARDEAEFEIFLARRAAGEPVHRILGWREFWGLRFFLSPETLEPRPDSETVIEVLLKLQSNKTTVLRFLDMGTGTGCLLLAALHAFPNAAGIGIDAAAGAVVTAQKNAAHLCLTERANFYQINWNNPDDMEKLKSFGPFDVVLCNPPYIPHGDIKTLQTEVRDHDPHGALDGGADGLAPYRAIAPQLKTLLSPAGIAIFEIGHNQAAAVGAILEAAGLHASVPYQDLGGNDRVITARR